MLLLAAQESVTLCGTVATPLPVSDSVAREFPALLTKASVAAAAPEDCGEKVTVKGIDCPAETVIGMEMPLTANSALVVVTDETVTGDPVALSVPFKEALDPAFTLPKFNDAGATVNCPEAVSLPDSAMFSRGSEAFEITKRLPELVPEMRGANTTLNVRLCPAFRLTGSNKPLNVNAALDAEICDTVTPVFPLFVRVSVNVLDPPAGRVPKLRIESEGAIIPAARGIPEPDRATVEDACHLW